MHFDYKSSYYTASIFNIVHYFKDTITIYITSCVFIINLITAIRKHSQIMHCYIHCNVAIHLHIKNCIILSHTVINYKIEFSHRHFIFVNIIVVRCFIFKHKTFNMFDHFPQVMLMKKQCDSN